MAQRHPSEDAVERIADRRDQPCADGGRRQLDLTTDKTSDKETARKSQDHSQDLLPRDLFLKEEPRHEDDKER